MRRGVGGEYAVDSASSEQGGPPETVQIWTHSEFDYLMHFALLARDEAAHATDGIFDAALLPGRIGIAEERLNIDAMERAVACELGAVVEGDGLAQVRRQRFEERQQVLGDVRWALLGGLVASRMRLWRSCTARTA
jgi:hypothetical protein